MRKLFLLPLFLMLYSCSNDSSNEPQNNNNTKLILNVLNSNQPVENVEISIFESEADLLNNNNIIQTQITNTTGDVTFENLETRVYFWKISTSCYLNNGSNNSQNALLNNNSNTFDIDVTDNRKGTINIINNTNNIYYYTVYTSGTIPNGNTPYPGQINANSSQTFNDISIGDFVYNFTPLNTGFAVMESFTLNCGATYDIILN